MSILTPQSRRFDAAIIALVVISVTGLSVAQGIYNFDPHHWGLMISNAVDMSRGRIPYKDIFIQYGFMTTLMEYLFFYIKGNIISIILFSSLIYSLGLIGVYFITFHFLSNREVALYAFLIAFLIHPIAIYPWPNYIAFPFITFGCLLTIKGKGYWLIGILGGILLGCATLVREGLFLPLLLSLLSLPLIQFWFSPERFRTAGRFAPLLGFALPLFLFFFYLWHQELFVYWEKTSIKLPELYASIFFKDGFISEIIRIFEYIFKISLSRARQTFFGLITLSALFIWFCALWRWRRRSENPDILFLALTSGLLLSSALHLNEIFRLSTSMTVGLGLVFLLTDRIGISRLFFYLSTAALIFSWFGKHNGNYFVPTRAQIEMATTSDRIGLFSGQRWNQEIFEYYDWYVDRMHSLETRSCGLRYLRNETRDAFLAALSPFKQHQLMPFGSGMHDVPLDDWNHRLRPDYDLDERLKERDILVIAVQKANATEERMPPNGYRVFDRRVTPKSRFLPDGAVTLLLTPEACGEPALSVRTPTGTGQL